MSGVMQPGPVTAATISLAAENKYAGLLVAVGHGIVEFPLMILIVCGMDVILKSQVTQIVIGLVGGGLLLFMAYQTKVSIANLSKEQKVKSNHRPVLTGIVLTAGNPYFLLWWATVGLAMATAASKFGIWAFVMFAIIHWLCDCVWLHILSLAGFHGSKLMGIKLQKIVLVVCAVALLFFGIYFIW
ncbi:MAG TPA: LysE family transporter, partial [Sedimentisphaerales bacterium]|nr:LysE family transporter [Sedimentisphaerales bacterium]